MNEWTLLHNVCAFSERFSIIRIKKNTAPFHHYTRHRNECAKVNVSFGRPIEYLSHAKFNNLDKLLKVICKSYAHTMFAYTFQHNEQPNRLLKKELFESCKCHFIHLQQVKLRFFFSFSTSICVVVVVIHWIFCHFQFFLSIIIYATTRNSTDCTSYFVFFQWTITITLL